MTSNHIESLSNLSFLAEGGSVWWDRKIKDLNPNELELTLHDSNSSITFSINSPKLGQLSFHSTILADKLSPEGCLILIVPWLNGLNV
jgi:hypothetical protein